MKKLVTIYLCGLVAMPVFAQEAEKPAGPWSGEIGLGYLASSGNTESNTATAAFEVTYSVNNWAHRAKGKYFSSRSTVSIDDPNNPGQTIDTDAVTAENYMLGWKSSYNFTEKNYTFANVDWIKNRFSGYPQQIFSTVGYGRRFWSNDTIEFDGELGVGYADQKAIIAVGPPEVTEDENGALGTAALAFKWIWTDTSDFSQTLKANYTEDNTFWESVSKVTAKLNDSLALGVSYTILGNTDVPVGIEKTDRFTAITLDYSF